MTDHHVGLPARTRRQRAARVVAWLLAVATAVLSLGPEAESLGGVHPSDKLLHLAIYAALALLFLVAEAPDGLPAALRIALCVALFGAALELTQVAVPHRTAERLDLLANTAGVTLGLVVWVTTLLLRQTTRP